MRFMLVAAMLMISLQAFAMVGDDTLHRGDAVLFDAFIGSSTNDPYIVTVYRHEDYGTLNYMVMWGAGSDKIRSCLCSIVACGLISEETSWSSDRVYMVFVDDGTLYSFSTNDARYVTQNYDGRGSDWAASYVASHMRKDI